MHRTWQFLLITTFIPLCWLLMQAVHELGHVTTAWATGGTVVKVVLCPTTISHTEILGGRHRALAVWGGPVVGVGLPLAILVLFKLSRWKWVYLTQKKSTCPSARWRPRNRAPGPAGRRAR